MQKKTLLNGLIAPALSMMLLSGCVGPLMSVEQTTPNYSASYLDSVASEWESRQIGPSIDNALIDWMVCSGL